MCLVPNRTFIARTVYGFFHTVYVLYRTDSLGKPLPLCVSVIRTNPSLANEADGFETFDSSSPHRGKAGSLVM